MDELWWIPDAGGSSTYLGLNCPGAVTTHPDLDPTPADILRAFRRIPLPPSTLHLQPPGGATLVNLQTNFFTTADDLDRTLTLLGHQVHLAIHAHTFTWHHGDHTDQTTHTPGTAYPKLTITHRYRTPGTVHPSLDTTWTADYRIDDGPWKTVRGSVTITGTPQTLTIRTATPVLVG